LRRRRADAGRPQRVLPAGRRAGDLRAAAGPEAPHPAPAVGLLVLGARGGAGRDRGGRQLPQPRHGRRRPDAGRGGAPPMSAPSSTFFTAPPEWQWLVTIYFFVGGLAGGCFFIATLLDVFGTPVERRLARLGYLVAFPAVVLSGLLLVVDLRRPERFWHMFL